jgi:hypothetical protein
MEQFAVYKTPENHDPGSQSTALRESGLTEPVQNRTGILTTGSSRSVLCGPGFCSVQPFVNPYNFVQAVSPDILARGIPQRSVLSDLAVVRT